MEKRYFKFITLGDTDIFPSTFYNTDCEDLFYIWPSLSVELIAVYS